MTPSTLPPFYRPHRPHSCRRATFHDYKRPGSYMITISKAPEAPIFSSLAGIPGNPHDPPRTILTPTGSIIEKMLLDLNQYEYFSIDNYVLMPDHIHILWRVKYWLDRDFGSHVGLFKSRCTALLRNTLAQALPPEAPLFLPKFNDRIVFTEKMRRSFHNYISDNPRRRLIVIKYPHLFRSAQRVRINGMELDVYGNFQLLRHPTMSAAVVSSRYTTDERDQYEREWREVIRTGGVLISPFISKPEKELRRQVIEAGGSIIQIVADGIGPKYKPQGEDFNLCTEGRCLHIGTPRPSLHKEDLKRGQCLTLNDLARTIAYNPCERAILINALGLR